MAEAAVQIITLSCLPGKYLLLSITKKKTKEKAECIKEESFMALFAFFIDIYIFSISSIFSGILFTSASFDPRFPLLFLPRPSSLSFSILAHVPSALGFKPLRASFPSSKSFKAECVWNAVFFKRGKDQSWTEIGTG